MLAPHQLRRRWATVHTQPYRAEGLARDHRSLNCPVAERASPAKMQPGSEGEKCEAEAVRVWRRTPQAPARGGMLVQRYSGEPR